MNLNAWQQAKFGSSNQVMLNNLRPPYSQQEEPSLFHESYTEETTKLPDLERNGHVSHSDNGIFKSEYNVDLLKAFFFAKNKDQRGLDIPQLPLVLETSSCKESFGNLKNDAYVTSEYETMHLGKKDALTSECKFRALVGSGLSENATINDENLTKIGDGLSANMHEQGKPIRGGLNPATTEKIWDGLLKLNTSTTVSMVAFFKSGEKVQDLNWPDHVEIKGKVRLQAFEKFIQELPRSRNRALMVISLCWKVGSCKAGLEGMMEIAKGYRESEKVGFAQIPPGIDLYVCPRSDIIITILAKYGFFKGMAAVEEDQSSLIGCVVWRRGQSSSTPASKSLEEKKNSKQEQPVKSAGLSIQGTNPTAMETFQLKKEQDVKANATDQESTFDLPASESGSSISLTDATETKPMPSTNNLDHANISHCASVQTLTTSIPYSSPLVAAQQSASPWSSFNFLQETTKQTVVPPITSENLGKFGSGLTSGPRPLIAVNSSNFQFQPQLIQTARSDLGDGIIGKDSIFSGEEKESVPSFQESNTSLPGLLPLPIELLQMLAQFKNNDSTCFGKEKMTAPSFHEKDPVLPVPPPSPAELLQRLMRFSQNVPNLGDGNTGNDFTSIGTLKKSVATFQESKPVLPRPPPLPAELQRRLIQSNKNVPKPLNERIQETEAHFLHHFETRGPADILEIKSCSLPQIQKTRRGPNDDDDLPEFDFDSACGLSALTGLKPSEDMKERAIMPSPFHSKLSTTSEPASLTEHLEEFSPEKPSTQSSMLTSRSSCIDRAMELRRRELRHGIGSSRKSRWEEEEEEEEDDDDDMPEWCPPDAELPEPPLLSASAKLSSQRSLHNPVTAAPPSFHPRQSRDLPQRSQRGLLGARPAPTAAAASRAEAVRSGSKRRPEPLGSRERNTSRSHAAKFDRKSSPYDCGRRQRRR